MIKSLATLIGASIYAALAASGLVAAGTAEQSTGGAMLGFSVAHTPDEQAAERNFDADLDAAQLREWMRSMASAPNQVGSAHDKANAEFMLQKFREWGWDASIETFSVLYPTPRHLALQLIAPKQFTAKLARARDQGRCDLGQRGRRTAAVQRLRRRRRCHRRTGVCEPRHARRLQGTRSPRHQRQGPDRDRALRRRLARAQAQARLRTRRDRLPDLFRSARRWLRPGRRLSERAAGGPPTACNAARWPTCRSIPAIR